MALARVRIDRGAVRKLIEGPNGPVDVYLRSLAVRIAAIARQLCGHKSGKLARSIKVTRGRRPGWNVEARAPYALYHHNGTRPHQIEGDPLLVFFWDKTGETMFLPSVDHPGTKPNPFLINAAKRVGLKVNKLV
jgi:hypothetical protein